VLGDDNVARCTMLPPRSPHLGSSEALPRLQRSLASSLGALRAVWREGLGGLCGAARVALRSSLCLALRSSLSALTPVLVNMYCGEQVFGGARWCGRWGRWRPTALSSSSKLPFNRWGSGQQRWSMESWITLATTSLNDKSGRMRLRLGEMRCLMRLRLGEMRCLREMSIRLRRRISWVYTPLRTHREHSLPLLTDHTDPTRKSGSTETTLCTYNREKFEEVRNLCLSYHTCHKYGAP